MKKSGVNKSLLNAGLILIIPVFLTCGGCAFGTREVTLSPIIANGLPPKITVRTEVIQVIEPEDARGLSPCFVGYVLNHFVLLKDSFFLGITTIYVSATGAFYAFIGISSYLYINDLGVTPIMYSYIYILMAVGYLAGNQYMMALNRAEVHYKKIIGIGVFSTLAGAINNIRIRTFYP